MTAATIITLRETLEASLVVGIVLSYLHAIDRIDQCKWVWRGVGLGVLLSIILAWAFHVTLGGFSGQAEELYEGIVMLVAAGLITWMITWMMQQKKFMRRNIETKVDKHIKKEYSIGIFFLILSAVMREGIETVIFLQAAYLQASGAGMQLLGAGLGIVVDIILSLIFFKGLGRMSIRYCFSVTSALLILFAAGLVAHGVHELQEAGVIPILVEHVWDTNMYLNEAGAVGGMLKALFGYNGNPNLLEVAAYLLYLAGVIQLSRRMSRQ